MTRPGLQELLTYLYGLRRRGIKVGLEHTRTLLEKCGNPHHSFSAVHIAGTNGKGSTAAMIASILRQAGYRVGLYTSPHLIRFNERIRVNGIPITDNEIVEFVTCHQADFEAIESTFFEATTALACWYFARRKVDMAVIETGLGGRLDSTNVLTPDVSVITSIGVDHTDLLGSDLKTIAFEKGGIIKENTPLVLAHQPPEVEKVLWEQAEAKKARVYGVHREDIKILSIKDSGCRFAFKGRDYITVLLGEHQVGNAALAIQTVWVLDPGIADDFIARGLVNVRWPGRLQRLHHTEPIFYDVAHNAQGVEAVAGTLRSLYQNRPLGVVAVKADKELERLAPVLREHFAELIITDVPGAGIMAADTLKRSLSHLGVTGRVIKPFEAAVQRLRAKLNPHQAGLIFGSHYIADAVFREFEFPFDNGVI
ncbi:MAG: bifunctional folylpolyglutamate synthase/dihydrofolate synthase [FCB group bacterium]|nr:bifunctional folylpolyglutamate synthase/dihydrofolate synthase [FCB group bacterium]